MKQRPIVVMTAMKAEMDFLLEKLENAKCEKVNQYSFYEGTMGDYPVVLCHCQVMSINAAVATYIAIQKYQPMAILSQGTAGAYGKKIQKGDIVLGQKCLSITSYKTPYKKEGEGSNSLDWELVNFSEGEEDKLFYQFADKTLMDLAERQDDKQNKIHKGILGSGDCWNKETDKILWLHEKYGILCEDMESFAVYKVANDFGIPVLGIRVISNHEILGEDYDKNTSIEAQKFTYELILKMKEKTTWQ